MDRGREAVCLLTHFLDDRIVGIFRRLAAEAGDGRDAFVLFNRSDDNNPGFRPPPDLRIFSFVEDDLRALGYPHKGRHIQDVDIELFSFPFHRAHPEYRRVWVVEYDVDYTGRWSELFDAFRHSGADLLATSIHRHAVNPGWENWDSVRGPAGRPAAERLLRAFLPFSRLSEAAYQALDQAYRKGWRGHYECTIPTILTLAGLKIEDIGGGGEFVLPGNRNRFYTSTPTANDLSPGTFVFRPIRIATGERPDTLWHPVKPPATHYVRGWRTGRMAGLTRRAAAAARRCAAFVARMWGGWDARL
jgi:hypothetical protein